MKYSLLAAELLVGLASSCSGPENPAAASSIAPAQVEALTRDFDNWYRYTYHGILLSRDFKALDTIGQPLSKKDFLHQLSTGRVLAVHVGTDQQRPIYQLGVFPGGHDPAIQATSKQLAAEELSNYNREGQLLPVFKFVDLNGVAYTSASTKGKVLVVKCWYTSCIACVDEFPAINALVDKYQSNQDVRFVSLAMNDAKRLRTFLKGREVKFAVVPASKAYLTDTLRVISYPTHFIIGRDGKIAKITTRANDLAVALAKEVESGDH